jgi:hypothetical protein
VLNESGVYVGEYMDGTFDSADQFHLGFTWQDSLGRILTYQVRDAADTWTETFLVDDSSADMGAYVSIDLDSSGYPSFGYFDADNGVPRVCDVISDPLVSAFLDVLYSDADVNYAGATGYYTSLAVDSLGYDHLAYYDDGYFAEEAQYARSLIPVLSSQTIDDKGEYTSIALMSDDTPCFAWQRTDTADLRFGCVTSSSSAGAVISTEDVDKTGAVGAYARLAFNSLDEPYIAYYDTTNKNLKVAHKTSSGWTTFTVDSAGDVGIWLDMVVDDDDVVHISYRDETNASLKYAHGQ